MDKEFHQIFLMYGITYQSWDKYNAPPPPPPNVLDTDTYDNLFHRCHHHSRVHPHRKTTYLKYMLRCRIGIGNLYIDVLLHLQIYVPTSHRIMKKKRLSSRLISLHFVDNFATCAVVSGRVSHLYESVGLPYWVKPSAYRWLSQQEPLLLTWIKIK